jgi:5-formyltetrahydrofolate cyclo-ligase
MLSKAELRIEALSHRADLARACPDFARRIAAFADDLKIAPHAVVGGYWPMSDEADPREVMRALAAKNHALALPRVEAKAQPLVFHRWREGEALIAHRFGMSEPHVDREVVVPAVLLVPLLAFDADGYRLGYGGGFYDRTLSSARAEVTPANPPHRAPIISIGVAYAGQEVKALPHEAHDHPLDAVLTENGLRHFHQTSGISR